MVAKEYCCYTRPYSNIEGYQRAYTLCYYASLEEEGVVLAVQRQQGGECTTEQVGHLPDGRLRTAHASDAVSVRKWRWTGPLDGSAGRRRGDVLALYGSRGRPAKRKADAICSICWF